MRDSVPDGKIRTVCLVIIAIVAGGAALYFLSSALIPFVLAVFLHFTLTPLMTWQIKHWKFPRWLALLTTTVLGLLLFAAAWSVFVASVVQLASEFPAIRDRFLEFVDDGLDFVPFRAIGMSRDEARQTLNFLSDENVRSMVPNTVDYALTLIGQGTLMLLFLLFMLAGKAAGKRRVPQLLSEVERSIQRYIGAKIILSAIEGVITWGVLAAFGVEFALVIGVLTFLLNFIPNVGSIVSALLPIPVVLLGDHSLAVSLIAISTPAAAQFVLGNVVEPKVMGKSLGIHPVTIMLALVVFGVVWGIPGLFLATPLIAIVKIVLDQRDYSRPLARLMEGDLTVLGKTSSGDEAINLGKA